MSISEKLYDRLSLLPKTAILNIMLAALDEMQGYNGQSETSAIMRVIGTPCKRPDHWRLPAANKLAKDWKENYPLLG